MLVNRISRSKRVRMKDIAEDLNVSVVTVSKVLRGHADISAATRERVLRRVRELNYEPNVAARSLVTGRSFMIGLVVPGLLHPFFGEVARAITRVVRPKGYSLVIASSEEDPELERSEIEVLLARQVDAIILASVQTSGNPLFKKVEDTGTPFVLIDRHLPGVKAQYVGVDDAHIGFLAARHLIERGRRRIAHLRGPEVSTAIGRLQGYRKALEKEGIEVPMHYVVTLKAGEDLGEESGYEAMRDLLAGQTPPDGVFCFNDEAATGALRAILDAGLRVPEDIAVIGVGNMRFANMLAIPLTTIDQNNAQIGERAAKTALRLIESENALPPKTSLVPVRLIERESTSVWAPARTTSQNPL